MHPVIQARHVLAHALFYFVERPTRLADYGVAFNTAAMLLVTAWLLLLTTLMAAASLAQALRRGCSKTTGALRPVGRGRGGLLAAADPRGFSFGTNTSDSSGEFGAAEPSRRHACLQLPAAGASGQTASTAAAEGQQQLLLLPPAAQHSSSEPLVCRAAALCWRAWLRGRAAALTVTPLQSWCVALPLTLLLHSCCPPPAVCTGPADTTTDAAASAVVAVAATAATISGAAGLSSSPGSTAATAGVYGSHCALVAPPQLLPSSPSANSVAPPSWRRLGSYQLVMGAVQRPVWDMALTALLMDGMRVRACLMQRLPACACATSLYARACSSCLYICMPP